MLRGFVILIGLFLLLEGIWELFSPVVFGVFTSNALHGGIHIVLGVVGLFAVFRGGARGFCFFLGALLLVVDTLWLLPATHELVVRLVNVNQPVAILNLVVALMSLLVAFASRERQVDSSYSR